MFNYLSRPRTLTDFWLHEAVVKGEKLTLEALRTRPHDIYLLMDQSHLSDKGQLLMKALPAGKGHPSSCRL